METKSCKQGGKTGLKGGDGLGEERKNQNISLPLEIPHNEHDHDAYLKCTKKLNA